MAAKTKPNKQHDARAASFRRIAKVLRKEANASGISVLDAWQVARILDGEAKLLRSMR